MCIVEIENVDKPSAACATPVADGMVVHTQTDRLQEMRQDALRFLLIQHPLDCPVCDAGGECELQNLTYRFGINRQDFVSERVDRPEVPFGTPLIKQWMDRCVMCLRCIQACIEIPGAHVLDVADRGFDSHVEAVNRDACISCGECLHVCPVGALTENLNPVKGRVWQTQRVQTTCTFCGCGCQLDLNVLHDRQVVKVTSRDGIGVNEGSLCVKGRFGYDYIHHPDRLTRPLVREKEKLREATWEEAFSVVSKKLQILKENYGGESLGTLLPSRGTNEEIYLLQKWTRLVLGSNNIDSGARLGSAPTLIGLSDTFGYGAMTNGFDGMLGADVILVVGANPDEGNLIFAHKIRRAIQQNNARVILVDPRRTPLEKYANIWLRPYPGSDVAWVNGLIKILIDEKQVDETFIKEKIKGFSELKKSLSSYTPESVEKITGIPVQELRETARLLGTSGCAVIAYGTGITQHLRGTDGVRALANLTMVTGSIAREGGGLYPLCAQSNCQGAFDMGGLPNYLPGYQPVENSDVLEKFEKSWGGKLPRKPGLSLGQLFDGLQTGKIKGVLVVGENPMITLPNPKRLQTGLEKSELLVVVDTFLTETAQRADVVFPGATYAEKDGTFTSMERRVQRVRRAIPPLAGMAEWEIVSRLASQMGHPMEYSHPSEIFSEIASLTPVYQGMDYERLEGTGIQWPCPEVGHPGTQVLYTEGFPQGSGRFHPVTYHEPEERISDNFPLWLSVGGTLYNYEIGTKAKRAQGLARWYPETALEIHPEDASALGISDRDPIRLASPRGEVKTKARISDRVAKGTVYLSPSFQDIELNTVLSPDLDALSGTPAYKACTVRIKRG